ncbi:hypothetical protein QFW77_05675 [Luteimonas sp. RD2P54]|uniref:Heme oxygenase n=1 Tax=Luteimonas endophytica TaxID=3042023 RepID=A0ABT6J6M1_9GAMM|nr:hypothetical protein [Luteimonas endophytica]MDH5822479.1 hypothetical protein [Luteimonas endophytica]
MRDRATYAGYLRGMHRFAGDFERALQCAPRLSAWLATDLAALGLMPLPPAANAPRVRGHGERAGWQYVMAGSSIGARRLLRDVRLLGFDGDRGATFLARHAVSEDWPTVQACLARFDPQDTREQALITQGALAAFALADRCFGRALASTHPGMERQQA